MAGIIVSRLVRADPDLDGNACSTQPGVPLTRHFGIGPPSSADTTRDSPGGDDRVGAGRRFAVMPAWLERDVQRRATRCRAGAAQRLDLGMRPAAGAASSRGRRSAPS